ncbi:MAG: 2-C-methyl-D-erythritol 2,4-cyclodiphosphate synthase [Candidatus Obscuribacterales bacterium]|nr:2-C-methyl-D-erythritol 2,4-cyclodiphosphate synthase [Candidatus Obscuribacterales bacterium]
MRIGLGYDIHPLLEGRPFLVGGIKVPFEKGPQGHSDGDVLCHAIIDAILGACALGDIGQWFSPEDEAHRGADSVEMLRSVVSHVKVQGFRLVNVDSNIICEKPKLSPHFLAIREKLASTLELSLDCVSVKAKTNEKLDAIGEGKAIAAQAIVLVCKD